MESISITVPLDYFALTRASDMLHGMAVDLENAGKQQARRGDDKAVSDAPTRTDAESAFRHAAAASGSVEEFKERAAGISEAEREALGDTAKYDDLAEKDAASVFGGTPGKPSNAPSAKAPDAGAATPEGATDAKTAADAAATPQTAGSATPESNQNAPAPQSAPTVSETAPARPAATTGAPADTATAPDTANSATGQVPPSVEVDSDGLPWDHRIHAGSKGKLAKTSQWKKKRGVDPALVEQVEAELRAAMSASPANPVEPSASAAEPASPPAAPAPAPAPAPAAPAGPITTFPALMTRITSEGIPAATVTKACNTQGLAALPLLAARPDLVPAVAAELFGG